MRYTLEDETVSHSKFGIVADDEYLLRVIYSPEHIINGSVIESAISLDDLSTRGFSLDREMYQDQSLITKRIEIQSQKKPAERQSSSIFRFKCGAARSIQIINQHDNRAFIVIDDAQQNNEAHASLYSAQIGLGKGELRKLRSLLLPLLEPVEDIVL